MDAKLLRTGIFGGSFNPVHIGHLALANYLCEYAGLDEVWFLVSPLNPLKQADDLLDDNHRLLLTRLAVRDYPRFHVSDFEFSLPRPSYMVHTLEALRQAHPDREFHLIIGSDNWLVFDRWYQPDRILADNHVIVYPRPGYDLPEAASLPPRVQTVQAPVFDISSTFIRDGIRQGKDLRFFLPEAVYDTILQNQWYQ